MDIMDLAHDGVFIVRTIIIAFFVYLFLDTNNCFSIYKAKMTLADWLMKASLWFVCGIMLVILFSTFVVERI
jgi:hypothetical protein